MLRRYELASSATAMTLAVEMHDEMLRLKKTLSIAKRKKYKFSSLRFTPAPSRGAPRPHPAPRKYQTPVQPPEKILALTPLLSTKLNPKLQRFITT